MRLHWRHCSILRRDQHIFADVSFSGGRGYRQFSATNRKSKKEDQSTCILLRHGQSVWNANPVFTGWGNPPLTKRGMVEAVEAGNLLRARGFQKFDVAFTSELVRALRTCELCLEAAGCLNSTPIVQNFALNERHYGALQGRRKNDAELLQRYGKEQIKKWRRDFRAVPPPMDKSHEHYLPPPAPLTESLQCCQKRVLKYWKEHIVPNLQPGKTILLVAHSNVLRALIAHLDEIPETQIPNLHIPNSVPCVYRFCQHGSLQQERLENSAGGTHGQWLFSVENQERLRGKLGPTASFFQSIFDAWDTNDDGILTREELEMGLRQLMGGSDIAVNFMAAKVLEGLEMNQDKFPAAWSPKEFHALATSVYQAYLPGMAETAAEGNNK